MTRPHSSVDETNSSAAIDALRRRTRNIHQRLHDHPLLAPLTRPTLTRAQYVLALRALQRFHESVEAALTPTPRSLVFSPAIVEDLVELGAGLNPLPACRPFDEPVDRDEHLGIQYVLEGSALGGRVIARHVADTLGWSRDAPGLSHFRRDGEDSGRSWRAFLAKLAADCRHPERCAETAWRTFAQLERWSSEAYEFSRGECGREPRDRLASEQKKGAAGLEG
ncbi:MAG: biliverdin-producing heme oxygenase [Pseudomonadota bacterium]